MSFMFDSKNQDSIKNAKKLIRTVLDKTLDNSKNPASLNFFQSDTYKFIFLMSFMWEYLEGSEISQEYAISLVPKKFASRIKRLQVLKQAVKLGYISETSSSKDKRRRLYEPTPTLMSDFLSYVDAINSKTA